MYYNDSLEKKNEEMQATLDEQKAAISRLSDELSAVNTRYQNLKMARNITSDVGNVKEAKNRFNKLVREIDKCISLLNE